MNHINSYPTVFALGHKMIADIFKGEVLVEEKFDGSQFSFGILDGELVCRSKGKQMILDAPEKMFNKAIETIREIEPLLHEGWIYRTEFLSKPKHNAIAYSRVPSKYLMLFDVATGLEEYLSWDDKADEAVRLGLEFVRNLWQGVIEDFEMFKGFLEFDSTLGGTKIEGVVIKNYNLFTMEKKIAIGKYVSEAYKEVQAGEWRKSNPSNKDIETLLIEQYRTEARWQKAIQHLREQGVLDNSPKDIGILIREVPADVLKECEDEIKKTLFEHFWHKISRGVIRGFPEFYKEQLAKSAFEEL